MIEKVRDYVAELLDKDKSGHGMNHVDRVTDLAIKFAEKENANIDDSILIAMLHDVDDYKLFGKEQQENLTNAQNIMSKIGIDEDRKV